MCVDCRTKCKRDVKAFTVQGLPASSPACSLQDRVAAQVAPGSLEPPALADAAPETQSFPSLVHSEQGTHSKTWWWCPGSPKPSQTSFPPRSSQHFRRPLHLTLSRSTLNWSCSSVLLLKCVLLFLNVCDPGIQYGMWHPVCAQYGFVDEGAEGCGLNVQG